jgi:ketosteroid isomerase-like protein
MLGLIGDRVSRRSLAGAAGVTTAIAATRLVVCAIVASVVAVVALAQGVPQDGAHNAGQNAAGRDAEDVAHAELRKFRDALVAAVSKNDLNDIAKLLDDDVVVTWQDGTTSRKPQGVREYYERMMTGPNRTVQRVEIDPSVDELTHLYGDTGVATGASRDLFVLADGRELHFDTRWTATVVKKQGDWRLASIHLSTSVFDNPVLKLAIRTTLFWSLVVGLPLAFALGFLTCRWWMGRRRI